MVIGELALWEKTGGRSGPPDIRRHPPPGDGTELPSPSRKGRSRSLFLVLLCLVVLWTAVGVQYLRSRIGATSDDSVGSFRRQLHVLQRTTPGYMAASRLRADGAASWSGR